MKNKYQTINAGDRNWLLPFNDMMTLLLTFFVLILSMSKVDTAKVGAASNAVSDYIGMTSEQQSLYARVFDPFVLSENAQEQSLEQEKRSWGTREDRERLLKMLNGMAGVKAGITEHGIKANFAQSLFFRAGEAELAAGEHAGFKEILDVLRETNAAVRIEAHTPDPPLDGKYASSWELSTARAARLTEKLMQAGIAPRRISISGYGDSRLNHSIDFILTFNRN